MFKLSEEEIKKIEEIEEKLGYRIKPEEIPLYEEEIRKGMEIDAVIKFTSRDIVKNNKVKPGLPGFFIRDKKRKKYACFVEAEHLVEGYKCKLRLKNKHKIENREFLYFTQRVKREDIIYVKLKRKKSKYDDWLFYAHGYDGYIRKEDVKKSIEVGKYYKVKVKNVIEHKNKIYALPLEEITEKAYKENYDIVFQSI